MPDRIWNAAEYTRLSRDDGDKAESNSITSQKEIIREYVRRHPEFVIVKEYADDGYSGVNFERPGFKQMVEDIKAKKIDCVICKDLSRFARNYIDAGRYLEKIFPFMGVRFIAINDNYDSCGEKAQSDALIVPFKNLINDAYCRDIRMSLYAYGTDTPSSSATSFTLIKISPAIGKIPSFPDLWLIALPFYPQDSGRQPFSALCRFLFSLARSFHRVLPRRKYPLDGHSVWLF